MKITMNLIFRGKITFYILQIMGHLKVFFHQLNRTFDQDHTFFLFFNNFTDLPPE